MSEAAAKDLEMTKLSQSVSQLSLTLREKNGVVSRLSEELQASLRINTPPGFTNPNTENSDDRIKRRITELTSISAQMNAQEHSEAHNLNPPVTNVQLFEAPNRRTNLNDTVTDIERGEMPELNLEAAEPEVKSSARANIISLAQRIRALQGSGGG